MFKNKIIAITGGTGSFGQSFLKKIIDSSDVEEIRIISRDEEKQEVLRNKVQNKKVKFYISDVRDYKSLLNAFKDVNYVFHAAALKQVPSCEFYPSEAFKTNVIGSENVMDAAIERNVSRVVLLSTDKAVYPINAMGISKALMEKCMIAKSRILKKSETVLCATRYGNVLASRGSVVPLFLSQINADKSITITDPNMTRFFMTLEESVNLVFYAFKNGNQGDIFVQKSPSFTIGNLAIAIKEIFNDSNEIKIIGTRHGEKLYETLVSREEMNRSIEKDNYYRIIADNRPLNYEQFTIMGEKSLSKASDYTSHNSLLLEKDKIKRILIKLDLIKHNIK